MRDVRKSQNHDLRAHPAWSVNSGKMEPRCRDFPGFRHLRAAASSTSLKGSDILWPPGVGIFYWSDSSLLTSLVDSRSPVLCAMFFTSCKVMEFARWGTEHRWKERPDLPVSLLMVLHTLRLESIRLYQSLSSPRLGWRSDRWSHTLCPNLVHVFFWWPHGIHCLAANSWLSLKSWHALSMCDVSKRWQSLNGSICEKAKVLPINLAKVPTLHGITVGRKLELWWRYEWRPILWSRDLS